MRKKIVAIACLGMLGLVLLALGSGCTGYKRYEAPWVAQHYGWDYFTLLHQAYTDDDAARGFMLMGLVMDTAPAEEYSTDLYKLTEARGDKQMVQLVESLPHSVRESMFMYLAYEGGRGESETGWVGFKKSFPQLAQMIEAAEKP